MPLPSFLERFRRGSSSATSDAVPMSSSDVEVMRVRARRRLIGMVVLVGAGVVGFPWLFETKPRPMSGDIQIVQAQQASQSASSSPVAGATIAAVTAPVAPAAPANPATRISQAQAQAEREEFVNDAPSRPAALPSAPVAKPAASKPAAVAASKAATKPADKPVDKPAAKAPERVAEKPADKAKDKPATKTADKASDKPADKKSDRDKADKDKAATRYVVQFGAFADANSAHEARMKAERLGLKTYAQQVDTPQGKRIRVRLGPYADKAEADKAAASLRKAGLPGAVLTL